MGEASSVLQEKRYQRFSLPQMKTSSRFIKILIQVRISHSLRELLPFL